MRSIPVDLILHELTARLAELPDTQHRDLHRAISRGCIRPQSIAEEWTSGAGVAQQAAWLVRRLDGENMTTPRLREIAAETRAMEVAVARRLADCALSLLVTQDTDDAATAQTLLQAAQRVVGLATAKPNTEAACFTSATDSAEDGPSPVVLRYHLAATRDALGLGSGPVFLGDIVARAKALANAEAENANKTSIIANLKATTSEASYITEAEYKIVIDQRDTAWADRDANLQDLRVARRTLQELRGAIHEALGLSMDAATDKTIIERIAALKRSAADANEARQGHRLKVARDCLPPSVDIIVCLHGNDPATYRASNTDDEHNTPEAAVRAAWEHHLRPTQSATAPAFKVGDKVRFARRVG